MRHPRIPRPVVARRSLLVASVAAMTLAASPRALWASEGGEAGEGAAIEALPQAVAFLSLLGLFEAQHRIVAGLYPTDVAMAQEHLAGSHHAFYEDLADGVTALGLPAFDGAAMAFADAVNAGADAAVVQAAADAVYAAIDAVRAKTATKDQMKAAEALLRVAASDIEAGVDKGQVTLAQEYRDSWGFATVAQLWLDDLSRDADATMAAAAKAALSGRADVDAQYAGVGALAASGDPGALLAAAARVELAAFRLK